MESIVIRFKFVVCKTIANIDTVAPQEHVRPVLDLPLKYLHFYASRYLLGGVMVCVEQCRMNAFFRPSIGRLPQVAMSRFT
jgi:hypothetical protein